MAEIEYSRVAEPATPGAGFSKLIGVAGAMVSIALVVGIGIWGYRLVMRDVNGIPVVRALEGPMRIQPDDPGGSQADHQGLAVNAVAASGVAAAPPDRVMLAPPPVPLSSEDIPVAAMTPDNESGTAATMAPVPAQTEADPTPQPARITPASVAATATGTPELLAMASPSADQDTAAAKIVTGPGVTRSLRPHLRPTRAVLTGAEAAQVASETASLDVDPDSLPAGTRLAQLGAFESADLARSEWVRLSGKFSEYFTKKQRVIQKATSGGRTFYRLRVLGFTDLSEARRFCAVLMAENADCIPVSAR